MMASVRCCLVNHRSQKSCKIFQVLKNTANVWSVLIITKQLYNRLDVIYLTMFPNCFQIKQKKIYLYIYIDEFQTK